MSDAFPCPGGLAFEIEDPRDESLFVRGFQAGRIYELLKEDPDGLNGYSIPRPDVPFVLRIIALLDLGRVVTGRWAENGWNYYLTGPNPERVATSLMSVHAEVAAWRARQVKIREAKENA